MQRPLNILLLEDDHTQLRDLVGSLQKAFRAKIVCFKSEHEFRRDFESIAANSPDIAILDRMVRWANASEEMPPPPQIPWDPEQAGVRCAELLQSDQRTRQARIVLYSVLGDDGETGGFESIVKEMEFENVVDWIKDLNRK